MEPPPGAFVATRRWGSLHESIGPLFGLAPWPGTAAAAAMAAAEQPPPPAPTSAWWPRAGGAPVASTTSPRWGEEPLVSDIALAAVAALFLLAARFLLHRLVTQPVGRWLLFSPRLRRLPRLPAKSVARLRRFTDSAWKLLFYGGVESLGLGLFWGAPWLWDARLLFAEAPRQPIAYAHKAYYGLQLGFYACMLLPDYLGNSRSDRGVMAAHHVLTVGMMGLSYYRGYFRLATAVLLVLDPCDVLMEAAKLFRYSGAEVACSALFVLFAASWVVLRLWIYPRHLIHAALYSSLGALRGRAGSYYALNGGMALILGLNVYWGCLIARMLVRQVRRHGVVDKDIRSDSD